MSALFFPKIIFILVCVLFISSTFIILQLKGIGESTGTITGTVVGAEAMGNAPQIRTENQASTSPESSFNNTTNKVGVLDKLHEVLSQDKPIIQSP